MHSSHKLLFTPLFQIILLLLHNKALERKYYLCHIGSLASIIYFTGVKFTLLPSSLLRHSNPSLPIFSRGSSCLHPNWTFISQRQQWTCFQNCYKHAAPNWPKCSSMTLITHILLLHEDKIHLPYQSRCFLAGLATNSLPQGETQGHLRELSSPRATSKGSCCQDCISSESPLDTVPARHCMLRHPRAPTQHSAAHTTRVTPCCRLIPLVGCHTALLLETLWTANTN